MNRIEIQSPDASECVEQANATRLLNPGRWIEFHFQSFGAVAKSFGTSIQIARKNGVDYGGSWDLSVGKWKSQLTELLES